MLKTDFINMEYEARVMISEEQYHAMISYYKNSKKEKKYSVNVNTYFDYDDLSLTNNHIVLRARNISDKEYELTLKAKQEKGDIEINHALTSNEYNIILNNHIIPDSNVKEELVKQGIDFTKLKLIATLRTERLELQYKRFLLVIDKNEFRGRVDYNVEVESDSKNSAKRYLIQKIRPFGVTYKKGYISKSRRAIFDL